MSQTAPLETPAARPRLTRVPAGRDVDIVVPVYNEEAALERSIRGLHRFLSESFRFGRRIVIADNASTDATPEVARRLARELGGVEELGLERKGRGRALRAAWSRSDARVVAYMDVDLSTDLRALLPLVAPLLSGHSDVAIGSRLANGARVFRGPKREVISRGYNPSCTRRCARASATPSAASRPCAGTRSTACSAPSATMPGSSHLAGLVVFVLTLGLTSGALAVLHASRRRRRGRSSSPS